MKKVFLALAVIATLSLTSCKKEVKQVVLSCPSVGVDLSMDIHKAKGGFKDAMQKVCETPGVKNSARSKYLKDRYNL